MFDDPFAEFSQDPGATGDVARGITSNPPARQEAPWSYEVRIANEADAQRADAADQAKLAQKAAADQERQAKQAQTQQKQIRKATFKEFKERGMAAFEVPSGEVAPVKDATGQPLTNFDQKNSVGYDSAGQPQRVSWEQVLFNDHTYQRPKLVDPYAGAARRVDKRDGSVYLDAKGLEWKPTGEKDPETVQALKDRASDQAATALGSQASMQARDARVLGKEVKDRTQSFESTVPGFVPTADADAMHKAVDDLHDDELTAPEYNERQNWYDFTKTGPLSPKAQAARAALERRRAATHGELDGLIEQKAQQAQAAAKAAELTRQADALKQERNNRTLAKARQAGVAIPGFEGAPTIDGAVTGELAGQPGAGGNTLSMPNAEEFGMPEAETPVGTDDPDHSVEWNERQRQFHSEARAAGLPPAPDSRALMLGAIQRSETAGYKVPHFIGRPDEPEGDRSGTMDAENIVRALLAQQADAVRAGDDATAERVGRERQFWQQQAAAGMSAEQWKRQTGEDDPVYTEAHSQPLNPVAKDLAFKAGDQAFKVDGASGAIAFDPSRLEDAVLEAFQAGHIDKDKFRELLPKAQLADKAIRESRAMVADDSVAAKLKALGTGATRGAAFLAGMPAGAGIGAWLGGLGGPAAEVTVPLGTVIGGALTGSLSAWTADKILKKFGEHNATVQGFLDAAEAHPNFDAAGNLVAVAGGLPKAGMQAVGRGLSSLAKAAEGKAVQTATGGLVNESVAAQGKVAQTLAAAAKGYETAGGGLGTTISNFAKEKAMREAAGASGATVAKAIASRIGQEVAANVFWDTMIKNGANAFGLSDHRQTLSGAAQAAIMGAMVSGHGITFKSHTAEDVGKILYRFKEAKAEGRPVNEVLSPQEIEVANTATAQMEKRIVSGDYKPNDIVSVEQALTRGQNYGVAVARTERPVGPARSSEPAQSNFQSLQHVSQPGPTDRPLPSAGQSPRQPAPESGVPGIAESQRRENETSPSSTSTAGMPTGQRRNDTADGDQIPGVEPTLQQQSDALVQEGDARARSDEAELQRELSGLRSERDISQIPAGSPSASSQPRPPHLDELEVVNTQAAGDAGVNVEALTTERTKLLEELREEPQTQGQAALHQAVRGRLKEVDALIAQTKQAPPVTGNPATATPTTFTTAKGSSYILHEDGTTTRNKAARAEHPGDVGQKPRSVTTFFVDDAGAQRLSEVQARGGEGKRVLRRLPDGQWGVAYVGGKDDGRIEQRTVTSVSAKPAVGLQPVELWGENEQPHFGNKITQIGQIPDAVAKRVQQVKETADFYRKNGQPERADWLLARAAEHEADPNAQIPYSPWLLDEAQGIADGHRASGNTEVADRMQRQIDEHRGVSGPVVRPTEASKPVVATKKSEPPIPPTAPAPAPRKMGDVKNSDRGQMVEFTTGRQGRVIGVEGNDLTYRATDGRILTGQRDKARIIEAPAANESAAPAPRELGDIQSSDAGKFIETKGGKKGRLLQVGPEHSNFIREDGQRLTISTKNIRVLPEDQQATTQRGLGDIHNTDKGRMIVFPSSGRHGTVVSVTGNSLTYKTPDDRVFVGKRDKARLTPESTAREWGDVQPEDIGSMVESQAGFRGKLESITNGKANFINAVGATISPAIDRVRVVSQPPSPTNESLKPATRPAQPQPNAQLDRSGESEGSSTQDPRSFADREELPAPQRRGPAPEIGTPARQKAGELIENSKRANAPAFERFEALGVTPQEGTTGPGGLEIKTDTLEIVHDSAIISDVSAFLTKKGLDPQKWMNAAMSEEAIHLADLAASGAKSEEIHERIWKSLPDQTRKLVLAAYPAAGQLFKQAAGMAEVAAVAGENSKAAKSWAKKIAEARFTAAAEYLRMLTQQRRGEPLTEQTFGVDVANLRRALAKTQPKAVEDHYVEMETIVAVPRAEADPTSEIEPTADRLSESEPHSPTSERGPPHLSTAAIATPTDEQEVFFSGLQRNMRALPQETMTVEQATAAVRKGAKADEIEATGILQDPLSPLFGKKAGDKVTRDELIGYATERAVRVQDKILGGESDHQQKAVEDANAAVIQQARLEGIADPNDYALTAARRELSQGQKTQQTPEMRKLTAELADAYEARSKGPNEPTRFSSYTLPGETEPNSYREMFVTWPKVEEATFYTAFNLAPDKWGVRKQVGSNTPVGDVAAQLTQIEAEKIASDKNKAEERRPISQNWQDGHAQYYNVSNPVVRIRRNLRTDADGHKTYFIEEMQGPGREEQSKMPEAVQKRIYEIGMKRALRDAVDEGADAIGWTTGEQQAARYDLSKHLGRVEYSKVGDDRWDVAALDKKNKQVFDDEGVSQKRLEDVLGKDLTAKIVRDEGNEEDAEIGGFKAISGLDLKVGGEGLKRLYDVTLLRIANKLVEKFGGKVGAGELPVQEREDGNIALPDQFHSMEIPKAWKDEAPMFSLFAADPRNLENSAEPSVEDFSGDELTPDQVQANGPHVAGLLQRVIKFWRSATDVLSKATGEGSEKFHALAQEIRLYLDDLQRLQGEFSIEWLKLRRKEGKRMFAKAEEEVGIFYRLRDTKPENAGKFGMPNLTPEGFEQMMSPAGKEHLRLYREETKKVAEIYRGTGVQSKNQAGEWGPTGELPDYHHRRPQPKVRDLILNPDANPKELRKVLKAFIDEKIEVRGPDGTMRPVRSVADLQRIFSSKFTNEMLNDHFGGLERRRELPFPNQLIDYSYQGRRANTLQALTRAMQVKHFGQNTEPGKLDAFSKLLEPELSPDVPNPDFVTDPGTAEYVKTLRDQIFGVRRSGVIHQTLQLLSNFATGSHLPNPVGVLHNGVFGVSHNAAAFGIRNTVKGLLKLATDWRNTMDEAIAKGIVKEDVLGLAEDNDRIGSSMVRMTGEIVAKLFKVSGWNLAEAVVRGSALPAVRYVLQDGLLANQKNPESRDAQLFRAMVKRNHLDVSKLLDENGDGPETDHFIRTMINAAQGGYKPDQLPLSTGTPAGRVLLKYTPWAFQATRQFEKNVVDPLIGKDGAPISVAPLLRYLLMTIAGGAAAIMLKEKLFGTADRTASIDEIGKTWPEDQRRALAIAAQKLWIYQVQAGAFGIAGNWTQALMDFTERSRFKSPFEPPSTSIVTNAAEQVLRAFEQGKLSAKDLDDFMRAQFGMYRVAMNGAGKAGLIDREKARQDQSWLSGITHRYGSEIGVEGNRSQTRPATNRMTPYKRDLLDAIREGDAIGGRSALKVYLSQFPKDKQGEAMHNLSISVRASQPVRVGTASEPRRELFMQWARRRLTPEDVQRINAIDKRYRQTAERLGLFEEKPIAPAKMTVAREKLNIAPGRVVPAPKPTFEKWFGGPARPVYRPTAPAAAPAQGQPKWF